MLDNYYSLHNARGNELHEEIFLDIRMAKKIILSAMKHNYIIHYGLASYF